MVSLRPKPPIRPKKKQQDPKTPRQSSSTPQGRRSSSSSTQELGLAVGLRFHPTDLELVDHYLQSRYSMGDNFRSDFVAECPEFYGEDEPWVIWHVYGGDDSVDDKTLYFFTHRKRLSLTAKRFDRKVGSGTWSGQCPREIKDDGVVVGIKREFRYEGGCDEDHNEAWLMQEYQIVDDDSDLVLCSLRKNPRKAPPAITDQCRAKRQSLDLECSNNNGSSEQSTCVVDELNMEEIDFNNLGQEGLLPCQFVDDPDCYYPELDFDHMPDFSSIDELFEQNATRYDNNNCGFVSNDDSSGQLVQFQGELLAQNPTCYDSNDFSFVSNAGSGGSTSGGKW